MASKQRRSSTIYENSTLMAVNFLRTSSLALAEMALGGRPAPAPESSAGKAPASAQPTVQAGHVRRLSVEPERHTTAYLMEGSYPASASATATSVDESAAEYIRRVRERFLKENHGNGRP